MNTFKLNTLPQELVNQIAAGEVIERPSSIVKELLDNSIDAKATKIQIKILNGGIDLIEVSDNGVGIPQENLSEIFKAHTTSKISSLEDLNNLLTMGFRGEALSTILSVSNVTLCSKYVGSEIGAEIQFKNMNEFVLKKAPRESGTVITVKNIFENIPARKKFLKTAQTEYKKILDVLYPYFLIYPNIHFEIQKDGKNTLILNSIPNSKENTLNKDRVHSILKGDFVQRLLPIYFNGNGIKISGLISHPSDHQKRNINQYMFVNRRNIWDSGIAKAVLQGYERYIPFGEKVPFLILIDINPELIDVNVHPRKEEIRFLNPFRAYAAVEEAVKKSISSVTTYHIKNENIVNDITPKLPSIQNVSKEYVQRDIVFSSNRHNSVNDSLLFSKELLSDDTYVQTTNENITQGNEKVGEIKNMYQIFNKYILVEFVNHVLWIVDQHAAAERVTFEKLKKSKLNIEKQQFLVPTEIQFSSKELIVLEQLKDFFSSKGLEYEVKDSNILISSVPVEFVESDFKKLFDEIFSLSDDIYDISKQIEVLKEDILATMACHGSVRSGQNLFKDEMIDLINRLIECENPYSCPHGRPAVWKLRLSDIDSNFDRTY